MTVTVAVIAMGEMGAGVARRLVERGAGVRTNLDGRSEASAARAAEAGVEVVQDDAALVTGADFILSIVPPARAGTLAKRLLPAILKSGGRPLYADCNAVAPQTVLEIAAGFQAAGLPFADAGILGGPPTPAGYNPRIYASGETAGYLARLNNYGLDVKPFSKAVGDASALKMAFAGCTKGSTAIAISMMLGAARAGVAETLWKEIEADRPGLLSGAVRQLPMVYKKAYRWDGEMEEIARFLKPETGGSKMFKGAADLYQAIAKDFAEGPDAERMALLEGYIERGKTSTGRPT